MGVYISFYKATNINITCRKDVNVIRQKLIKQLYKRIHTPIVISQRAIRDMSFLEEMEAYRISSIPAKKKQIKWLRKASCKQVIRFAHEVDLWLFGGILYKDLNINFPIGKYIEEESYAVNFKNAEDCLTYINKFGKSVEPRDVTFINLFFNYYGRKGLIQIY